MRRTAALIVGGGPAGSAAAITLARGGARPLLIERSREPQDALCGGFLGWDALAALARLGIDPHALGARPVHRLRVVVGTRQAEADLPHPAAGLSRLALDAALLVQAEAHGAEVARGVSARQCEPERLALSIDGAETVADALFLATGKHELRGVARPRDAAGDDPALGLRRRYTPDPGTRHALDGVIELHLIDRGYVGLVLQEGGAANLCLSVAESRLKAAGGDTAALWRAILDEAPRLAERCPGEGAWQSISRVPYGWRARQGVPGLFRLGDQAAVIPSLAGDGVAIALTSGIAAAQAWARGGPAAAPAFQRDFARATARPVGTAVLLRGLAERPHWAAALVPWLGRVPGLAATLARLTRIGR